MGFRQAGKEFEDLVSTAYFSVNLALVYVTSRQGQSHASNRVQSDNLTPFWRRSMALLKTSNPALSGDAFRVGGAVLGDSMTVSGTVNKTGILLICVVAAACRWNLFTRSPQTALPLLAVGGIGGFIVALVTIFKKAWKSPVTAPMYALLEGLVLGSASAMLELRFPGIAMQCRQLAHDAWNVGGIAARLPVRPHPRHRRNSRSGLWRRRARLLSSI